MPYYTTIKSSDRTLHNFLTFNSIIRHDFGRLNYHNILYTVYGNLYIIVQIVLQCKMSCRLHKVSEFCILINRTK